MTGGFFVAFLAVARHGKNVYDEEKSNILMRDGLSLEVLHKLSFESKLGINLKKNLHYFDKESLLEELQEASNWYDELEVLHELALDYRIKSI